MQHRQLSLALLLITLARGVHVRARAIGPRRDVGGPGSSPAERKYLLETVDDAAVVQLYADGFDALPLREKTLICHLYQAALAGRDIFIDQKHRHALEMRGVLEAVITHPQGVDAATLARNRALHQAVLDQQRPLQQPDGAQVRAEDHARGVRRRRARPRSRPAPPWRRPRANRWTRCWPAWRRCSSTPAVEPIVTNKAPGPGKDILLASANNLYSGVSLDGGRGVQEGGPREERAELAAGEAERQAGRRGLQGRRPLLEGDHGRSSRTSRPPSRLRPSPRPTRCAR